MLDGPPCAGFLLDIMVLMLMVKVTVTGSKTRWVFEDRSG